MARWRAGHAACVFVAFALAVISPLRCAADPSKEPKSVSVTLRTRWEVRPFRGELTLPLPRASSHALCAAPAPRSPRRWRTRLPSF
jgi:hypothetical protein